MLQNLAMSWPPSTVSLSTLIRTVIVKMAHLSCNELLGTVCELFSLGKTRKPTQLFHIPNKQKVMCQIQGHNMKKQKVE